MSTTTVAVCVKHVPVGGAPLRIEDGDLTRAGVAHGIDPINELGLEWALQQREIGSCDRVIAICMGPSDAVDTLRKALAMGADEVLHVCDDAFAGADVRVTARALAAASRWVAADLLVMGYESADGSSGVVPAAVAAVLDAPLVSRVRTASLADGTITARRDMGVGLEEAVVQRPAVLSMVEGAVQVRYPSLKDVIRTKKAEIPVATATDLGVSTDGRRPQAGATLRATPTPMKEPVVVDIDAASQTILSFLAEAGVRS
jgi:electron transfer flavoprotein beta subunit